MNVYFSRDSGIVSFTGVLVMIVWSGSHVFFHHLTAYSVP